jgi:catechol 2,3-dioxygenase-like lactoylglutathione lyase family enzyme
MPQRPPDPTQWNHANPIFEVSNVHRSLGYYRDVLGLTPSWMWEDRIAGVCAEGTPVELYLAHADSPSPTRLSVFVDDADAAYERYRRAGAEIVDEIETKPWGMRRFTVRDPDGNRIDISHEVRGSPK